MEYDLSLIARFERTAPEAVSFEPDRSMALDAPCARLARLGGAQHDQDMRVDPIDTLDAAFDHALCLHVIHGVRVMRPRLSSERHRANKA